MFDTYREEFRQSAESVANAAAAIQEDGGNEVIAQALVRIPAFAIASVTTSTTDYAGSNGPVITLIPVTAPAGYIGTLLLPSDVAAHAGGVELTTQYRDAKAMAAAVDPAQVEHMDSFDSLSFATVDGFRGLTLTTVMFDSEGAAAHHLRLVTSETPGMQDLPDNIGDASSFAEANESDVGSLVFFKKGEWVVTLHTAQPDGVTPLVDLAGLEALARTVADRL